MIKSKNGAWFWALAALLLSSALRAETPATSPASVDQPPQLAAAQKAYQSNDFKKAISLCREELQKNPQDAAAQKFLGEVLIVAAQEYYLLGNVDESYRLLSEALQQFPDLKDADAFYQKLRAQKPLPTARNSENTQAAPLPDDFSSFMKVLEKSIMAEKDAIRQTAESLQKIAQTNSQGQQEVLSALQSRETTLVKEVSFSRRYAVVLAFAAALAVILLAFLLVFTLEKIGHRREALMLRQSQEFLEVMTNHSEKALQNMMDAVRLLPTAAPVRAALPGIDSELLGKLHKIDVIDAEIIQENGAVSHSDEQVLKSLLKDSNPDVRARTVQVLLKYNPEAAFDAIQNMLRSDKSTDRLAAARILSGIATHESVGMLSILIHDTDAAVKRQAISSLQTLKRENLDNVLNSEIELSLSEISQEEGWIVH